MHTVLVILGGFAQLALCLLAARVLVGPGAAPLRSAIRIFLPLWLIGAGINMAVGVIHAGYSVAEELPIFLLIFAVPAAFALVLGWILSRTRSTP
ncbi:hypothetical protein [Lysobacter capsici]|uniref:hypothetical protein n=1 Tax=Lysobacter capsici TaxID=435897 RepID=UPI000627F19C|nr:hypothetical protein [Lysobacter capsici]